MIRLGRFIFTDSDGLDYILRSVNLIITVMIAAIFTVIDLRVAERQKGLSELPVRKIDSMNIENKIENIENSIDPYGELERLFHEPKRLAILSHLAGAENGLTFREIRDLCDLTDGNLNRHLKMLVDAEVVRIHKDFVGARPRTTVFLTDNGRNGFMKYLDALEAVLKLASNSARSAIKQPPNPSKKGKPSNPSGDRETEALARESKD